MKSALNVKPVLAEQVDNLVLGCTHYPLLKYLLQGVVGPDITLVDSAEAMAEQTAALLTKPNLHNPDRVRPEYHFWVTDVPLRFQTIGERFLGRSLSNAHVVQWKLCWGDIDFDHIYISFYEYTWIQTDWSVPFLFFNHVKEIR